MQELEVPTGSDSSQRAPFVPPLPPNPHTPPFIDAREVLVALTVLERLLPAQPFDKARARQDQSVWAAVTPALAPDAPASWPHEAESDQLWAAHGMSATLVALHAAESNLHAQAAPIPATTDAMLNAIGHTVETALAVRQRIDKNITMLATMLQKNGDWAKPILETEINNLATRMLDATIAEVNTLATRLNVDATGIEDLRPGDANPLGPDDIRVDGKPINPAVAQLLNYSPTFRKYWQQVAGTVSIGMNTRSKDQLYSKGAYAFCLQSRPDGRCEKFGILLEPREHPETMASTLAHEIGHVVFAVNTRLAEAPSKTFGAAMLYNEGQSLFTQQMVRREILAKTGKDIGLPLDDRRSVDGVQSPVAALDLYYDRYASGKITLDEACRLSAGLYRRSFKSDELGMGSSDGYEQYYDQMWRRLQNLHGAGGTG